MDVLKSLASPPSIEHYHLLLLIGALVSIVLYPYLGFLFGTSFLSHRLERKGRREGNALHVQLASDLIGTALVNKTVPLFLALLPSLSLVFVYAQLLQSTPSIAVSLAGFGFLVLLCSVALLYAYKYTFQLGGVLQGYKDALQHAKVKGEDLVRLEAYTEANERSHMLFGRYGVILGGVALFLISSSTVVATNPANWTRIDTVLMLFVSLDVYVRFFQSIALAAGATGIGLLFFLFVWKQNEAPLDPSYAETARSMCIRLIAGSFLVQPLFVLIGLFLLPPGSLSGILYGIAGLAIAFLLLSAQMVYAYVQERQPRHTASALFAFGCAVALFSINDEVALYNATKGQAASLSAKHERQTEELKTRLGVAGIVLTGKDIFDARCSACHLFDLKKVGPAYKDVLPKYEGKKDRLIAFVLNPVKVDPAFPPMPNQGLRPAEADSIVSYLLRQIAPAGPKSSNAPRPSSQK